MEEATLVFALVVAPVCVLGTSAPMVQVILPLASVDKDAGARQYPEATPVAFEEVSLIR